MVREDEAETTAEAVQSYAADEADEATDEARVQGRWRALPVPYASRAFGSQSRNAFMRGIAADGQGGAWLAARTRFSQPPMSRISSG